jgi:hypothetical protein
VGGGLRRSPANNTALAERFPNGSRKLRDEKPAFAARLEPEATPLRFFAERKSAMEHIAALLLIIGCSDNLAQCRELPSPVTVFETVEECEGALPVELRSFSGHHPQLFAKCLTVDPAMEEEDAELTWDVKPDGTLVASIGVPDLMVASDSGRTEKRYPTQE